MKIGHVAFPPPTGIRCLMLPFIQGEPSSVPEAYRTGYETILRDTFIEKGDIGFLTIDESAITCGKPHRGYRAQHGRALHTEAGRKPGVGLAWGGGWGKSHTVTLDADTQVLLASSIDDSCAIWDACHFDTSLDGDIGDCADLYPYEVATLLKAGDVHKIGILTPHESLPSRTNGIRQFIRIVSSGVHGRESYFTHNPLLV